MNRKIVIIFLLVIFIFPLSVFASSEVRYSSSRITGVDSAKPGDTVKFNFDIAFSGLKKDGYDTKGIGIIVYELHFDPSILTVTNISTPGWDSIVYLQDNQYYVLSTINEDNNVNRCLDRKLHCGNYNATISFFVKDTKETNAFVSMGYANVYLLEVKDNPDYVYNENEYIVQNHHIHTTKNFTIDQSSGSAEIQEPKSIINNSKPIVDVPKIENKQISNDNNKQVGKSNNSSLKSLIIKGYELEFNKDVNTYDINISTSINNVEVSATPEDSKSTIEIVGADNLKGNDYKILVKVKAENGSVNTYTINAKISDDNLIMTPEKNINKKGFKINGNKKKITIIAGIVIILLFIIVGIINVIENKKIDKKIGF